MPLLRGDSTERLVKRARERAQSAVVSELPRSWVNEEGVLCLLLPEEDLKLLGGGVHGGVVGARQALAAVLLGVKYFPTSTYGWANVADALRQVYGTEVCASTLHRALDAAQPWRAALHLPYGEWMLGKRISLESLEKLERADPRVARDAAAFLEVPVAGYLRGAKVLAERRVGREGMAVMLSTLVTLDGVLPLGTAAQDLRDTRGRPVAAARRYDGAELREVRPGGVSRPLLDGYVRTRIGGRKLEEKLGRAVEQYLGEEAERRKREGVEVRLVEAARKLAEEMWSCKLVRNAVRAALPAYRNLSRLSTRALHRAVAAALLDLAELYVKLLGVRELLKAGSLAEQTREQVRHAREAGKRQTRQTQRPAGEQRQSGSERLVEALGRVLNELAADRGEEARKQILEKLVPRGAEGFGDLQSFVVTRLPYFLHLIGRRLGTAFDLEKVLNAYNDTSPASTLGLCRALLELGVVLRPDEVERLVQETFKQERDPAEVLLSYLGSGKYLARHCPYAQFFAMGVPVTAVIVGPSGGRYVVTVNLKLFVNLSTLETEYVVGGRRVRVGNPLFRALDRVVRDYIEYAIEELSGAGARSLEDLACDSRLYHGLLYIFSELDLVSGDTRPVHSELLNMVREAVECTELSRVLSERLEKLKKRGFLPALVLGVGGAKRKVERALRDAEERLARLEERVLELATIYSPLYIERLAKASAALYQELLKRIEGSLVVSEWSGGHGQGQEQKGDELDPVTKRVFEEALEEVERRLGTLAPQPAPQPSAVPKQELAQLRESVKQLEEKLREMKREERKRLREELERSREEPIEARQVAPSPLKKMIEEDRQRHQQQQGRPQRQPSGGPPLSCGKHKGRREGVS